MTGIDLVVAIEVSEQGERVPHAVDISAGEVTASYSAAEQRITGEHGVAGDVAHASVSMSRSVENAERAVAVVDEAVAADSSEVHDSPEGHYRHRRMQRSRRACKHMNVALVDIYFSSCGSSYVLDSADVVEVTVSEKYLRESELLHFHVFEQNARTSADVYGDASAGGSFDEVAVCVELAELECFYSHVLLLICLSVQQK